MSEGVSGKLLGGQVNECMNECVSAGELRVHLRVAVGVRN